ncbi:DUF4190 domain-containing protein [Pyxidicoccus sp. 3LG]
MSVEVSPGALARCAVHPEELAAATCQRCGGFVCTACTTWVMGSLYCASCAARPEVNYLDEFRRQLWGRRDSGAYLVGAGTLLLAVGTVTSLAIGDVASALGMLAATGVGVCFFLGMRWARYVLPFVPLGLGFQAAPELGFSPVWLFVIPFVISLQLLLDTRSRLFFRMDVSEKALRRLWELRVNNPLARHALSLGVSAVFLPLLAPFAIVLGFMALRRVDLQARPPIGRRGQALAGIVLGVGALLAWALLFGPRLMGGLRGLSGL